MAACIGLGIVPEVAREMGFRLPKDPMLRDKAKRSGIRIPLTVGEVKDELMDKWEDNGWVHIVFLHSAHLTSEEYATARRRCVLRCRK